MMDRPTVPPIGRNPDGNGNPAASVTGIPLLETALGTYPIDQTLCNIAASYTDRDRIYTCGGEYLLLRECCGASCQCEQCQQGPDASCSLTRTAVFHCGIQ